jgi:hypothetical protein
MTAQGDRTGTHLGGSTVFPAPTSPPEVSLPSPSPLSQCAVILYPFTPLFGHERGNRSVRPTSPNSLLILTAEKVEVVNHQ